MQTPDQSKIESSVRRALEEDIGLGDITGELIDHFLFKRLNLYVEKRLFYVDQSGSRVHLIY